MLSNSIKSVCIAHFCQVPFFMNNDFRRIINESTEVKITDQKELAKKSNAAINRQIAFSFRLLPVNLSVNYINV